MVPKATTIIIFKSLFIFILQIFSLINKIKTIPIKDIITKFSLPKINKEIIVITNPIIVAQ